MKTLPKLVITDIDGVWTDGSMYYDDTDQEFKRFNTSDSVGVLFLKYLEIPLVIMTGENTHIVQRRADKLKIQEVHLGVKDKLALARKICEKHNISLAEVAFVGDDINDLQLLEEVGLSAVPSNAPDYIKAKVDRVLTKRGGDGAFREFVEHLVTQHSSIDLMLKQYAEERNLNQ
ncbi:MAG TPA: HAD-IIIA family hydrolase [Flavobacteriaceae bacterium]|nr:acylneuraminate cytidylyltransferase [Flavobacteriaceae bacterium]MAY54012.1 acylneuraminate cytidylyltransferase [Flavobacteriaceae bacterium]HBR53316.1 acylneuraminate cytidylyltransferase [Flavobacteriaceae bacterium]HIB47468.1 HAD-IIIA family hydrolase [Flavobacteriaceae bacterium]HIN99013.1 HAD-IIIA family hydrolase [Flavobacteriaceae bacterium]|tara:strand:- start:1213 stop:1737 length:525 start_codon:yes stop_codon:yes gene_type:complete